MTEWDISYPPSFIDWVTPTMRDIIDHWALWDKQREQWTSIVATEGQYQIDTIDGQRTEYYRELAVVTDEKGSLTTIGDDLMFYDHEGVELEVKLGWEHYLFEVELLDTEDPPIRVVSFTHNNEGDWGSAFIMDYAPKYIKVGNFKMKHNHLGYGIIMRKCLLERLNIPYHKASSVMKSHEGVST